MDEKGGNELLRAGAGAVLVVLGLIFLLQEFFGPALPFLSWKYLWPLFVILPGLAFFAAMARLGRHGAGLAIPGSIITTTGLVLLYQNATGHWQSWAYAWALIVPTSIGVGRVIQGWWSDRPDIVQGGRRVISAGLILFAFLAVFFELVLDISGLIDHSFSGIAFPILLIAAGAFLVARGSKHSASDHRWV